MDLVSIRGFVTDEGAEPAAYVVVPVDSAYFGRGARFKAPTSDFMLAEAIRFFNFGAVRTKTVGSPAPKPFKPSVDKNVTPIDGDSIEEAVLLSGQAYSSLIYSHVEWIYKALLRSEVPSSTTTKSPATPAATTARDLLNPVLLENDYIKLLLRDKSAAAHLVVRLLCDSPAGEIPASGRRSMTMGKKKKPSGGAPVEYNKNRESVLQFPTLREIHQQCDALLQTFHQPSGVASLASKLDLDNRNIPGSELWSIWVGSTYTLSYGGETDARVLQRFVPYLTAQEIGLTEKIYATLSLLANSIGLPEKDLRARFHIYNRENDFGIWEGDSVWLETRALEDAYFREVEKLYRADASQERKALPIDGWLECLRRLEDEVLFCLMHYPEAGLPAGSYGPVRSDLIWGVLLTSYLRLFLLRACLLIQLASIPFRLIFQGGSSNPFGGASAENREGIVGLIAVSLWEQLSGHLHPAVFAESAGNALPWFTQAEGAVFPTVQPNRRFEFKFTPKRSISDRYMVEFGADDSLRTAKQVYASLELPSGTLASGEELSALRTVIANNYLDLTPEYEPDDPSIAAAEISELEKAGAPVPDTHGLLGREPKPKARERSRASMSMLFPPRGPFPLPLEQNPAFLDGFFAQQGIPTEPGPSIFRKAVLICAPSLTSGCKLGAQVQHYVASWLYWKLMKESDVVSGVQKASCGSYSFDSRIGFNDGNIQYGGRHPRHHSHRDGYCADWSLVGNANEMPWHWTLHWPEYDGAPPVANATTQAKLPRRKSYAELLLKEVKPYPEWIKGNRGELAKSLQEARVCLRKARELQRAKPSDENVEAAKRETDSARAKEREVLQKVAELVVVKKSYLDRVAADVKDSEPIDARVLNILPRRLLIAQEFDAYNRRETDPSRRRRLVFLEYLTAEVRAVWDGIQEKLQQKIAKDKQDEQPAWLDVERCERVFEELEKKLAGLPVVPDRGAHIAHHVAQLAVTLSLPKEMLLGAPIYHLRAISAIAATLAEAGLPSPFSPHPDNSFLTGTEGWPLKLPILHCYPHDHHHHWHMQFWRSHSSEPHGKHIVRCIPFWLMLGIDFAPLIAYLKRYSQALSNKKPNSAEQAFIDDLWVLSEHLEMQIAAFEPGVRTKLFLNAKSSPTPEALRKNMVARILRYEEQRPTRVEIDCKGKTIIPRRDWPPQDSLLSRISKWTNDHLTELEKLRSSSTADAEAALVSAQEQDTADGVTHKRNEELDGTPIDVADEAYWDMKYAAPAEAELSR